MKKPLILSIEDEEDIHDALDMILSKKFELIHAMNGMEGLKKAIRNQPDLIMLDLKMSGMDGFQTCKALRDDQEFDNVPIIIMSAFNSVADRTKAFEMGADDYITKPFDKVELITRIQRKLDSRINVQKAKSPISSPGIIQKNFELDTRNLLLQIDSVEISLSAIEFKVIKLLADNFTQLVTREKILEHVWEKQEVSARLIDPHIVSLRNKIKNVNLTIQSVYRRGYILKSK